MISTADLTAMRSAQAATFDLTGVVKRNTLVADGAGGHTTIEMTIATVPCRVAPSNTLGNEVVVGGKLTSQATWLVTLPYGTVVKDTDWIDVEGAGTFDVVSIRAPHSRETAVVVLCVRRTGAYAALFLWDFSNSENSFYLGW